VPHANYACELPEEQLRRDASTTVDAGDAAGLGTDGGANAATAATGCDDDPMTGDDHVCVLIRALTNGLGELHDPDHDPDPDPDPDLNVPRMPQSLLTAFGECSQRLSILSMHARGFLLAARPQTAHQHSGADAAKTPASLPARL